MKNKEINNKVDKNNLYRTKYNQLLTRFDIINKELNQLKKNKNNEELISENEALKKDLNILKRKDFDNNKTENNEYKKNEYKRLMDSFGFTRKKYKNQFLY